MQDARRELTQDAFQRFNQRVVAVSQVQVTSRHACLLFERPTEPDEAVSSFVQKGLLSGEQCLFAVAPDARDEWLYRLKRHGIDVRSHQQRGSLELLDGWDGAPEAPLNSIERARTLWRRVDRGLTAHGAVRYVVDLRGGIVAGLNDDQLCHWEATLDRLVDGEAVRVLCLYDTQALSPALIHCALRTHLNVTFRGSLRQSPYYEAPRILDQEPNLNHSDADAQAIEVMLARLAEAT
jgi:hypothetical protein